MKTIAWYDPTNGVVSTDKDDPRFTSLGQLWPLAVNKEEAPTRKATRKEKISRPQAYTLTCKIWVDPPEGWKYGFPAIYDPVDDGNMEDWILKKGYPAQLKKEYGTSWAVRCWVAENEG